MAALAIRNAAAAMTVNLMFAPFGRGMDEATEPLFRERQNGCLGHGGERLKSASVRALVRRAARRCAFRAGAGSGPGRAARIRRARWRPATVETRAAAARGRAGARAAGS